VPESSFHGTTICGNQLRVNSPAGSGAIQSLDTSAGG
jgi:uncharacterized repeat protein (TIGR03803 family)